MLSYKNTDQVNFMLTHLQCVALQCFDVCCVKINRYKTPNLSCLDCFFLLNVLGFPFLSFMLLGASRKPKLLARWPR